MARQLAIALCLSVLLSAVCVRADSLDRTVSQSSTGKADVTFSSKQKNVADDTSDLFQFEFSTSPVEIRLKYYTKAKDTSEKVHYRIRFDALIVYTESNGQAGYQVGEENSILDLGKALWGDITCISDTTDNVFNCSATDKSGVLTVTAHIVSTQFSVTGVPVRPTSLKIDVSVLNQGTAAQLCVCLLR